MASDIQGIFARKALISFTIFILINQPEIPTMTRIFIIALVLLPLLAGAQKSIHIDHSEYLKFSSDSLSPKFINTLNSRFGEYQTLLSSFNEAPQSDELSAPTHHLKQFIDSIQKGLIHTSLASIHYDIQYNDNYVLSLYRIVTPEGQVRLTNSLHSDYPYDFPVMYDLKAQREIKSLSEFLTADGIRFVQRTLKKVICKRKELIDNLKTNINDCRIGQKTLDDFRAGTYIVSNNRDNNDIYGEDTTFYFYFIIDPKGITLGSNNLDHQQIICAGPEAAMSIPWVDILPYCVNRPGNVVRDICLAANTPLGKKEWVVKSSSANILDLPDEYRTNSDAVVKPYILKGEKATAIAETNECLKVKYKAPSGKEITGWMYKSDLE